MPNSEGSIPSSGTKLGENIMGKISKQIKEIQLNEGLTLSEVFKKYPYLEKLQFEEITEEESLINESKNKKLLLG